MNVNELAGQAPKFINNTISIFSGPTRFIEELAWDSKDILKTALVYYVLALAISLALQLPFVGKMDGFSGHLSSLVIFLTVGLLLSNVFITVALYLFGGRGGYRNNFIATCYIWGAGVLIWSVGALVSKGIMIIKAPSLLPDYLEFMQLLLANSKTIDDPKFGELLTSDALNFAVLVFAAFLIVMMFWFLFSWRVYRTMNTISAPRLIMALMIFLVFQYPFTKIISAIQQHIGLILF